MKLKLPTSWDAVTLAEWQAIRKILSEDEDPYLTECAIISTLSGADMDVIMSISRHEHGHIMCHTLKFPNGFTCNGSNVSGVPCKLGNGYLVSCRLIGACSSFARK